MEFPKITVGIPCYGQAQYLSQAIESVLAQTRKPLEIIVCNDGSPDNTRQIAQQYDVKYIEQVNKGLASARNTIIMNSSAECDYLLFLDADDMMLPNCVERISQVIEQTYSDIVAPSFKCFGKFDTPIILMPNPKLEDFKPENGVIPANRIGYFSAIKKEALLEVGGYSPRMIFGWEDYHLWINLLSVGKEITTIPEVLILYRTKDQSMITEANAHAIELWEQIYKDFPDLK